MGISRQMSFFFLPRGGGWGGGGGRFYLLDKPCLEKASSFKGPTSTIAQHGLSLVISRWHLKSPSCYRHITYTLSALCASTLSGGTAPQSCEKDIMLIVTVVVKKRKRAKDEEKKKNEKEEKKEEEEKREVS